MEDELLGVQVLDDLRVYGKYKSECVILLPGSKEFTIVNLQSGLSTHHFSKNVLSVHRKKLLEVLEFANLHLDYPYLCLDLLPFTKYEHFNSSVVIDAIHWLKIDFLSPASLQEIYSGKYKEDIKVIEDGSIQVISNDRLCTLTLAPHTRYFCVDFPLLLEPASPHKHSYVWMRQIFSLCRFPPRWEYPLALALATKFGGKYDLPLLVKKVQEIIANNEHNNIFKISPEVQHTIYTESDVITALPMCDANLQPPVRSYAMPPVSHLQLRYPIGKLVLLEWSPYAFFQYFQKQDIVETVVFADDSVLLFYPNKVHRELGTFSHYIPSLKGESRIYNRAAVPTTVRLVEGQGYQLAFIADHAIALYTHSTDVLRNFFPKKESVDKSGNTENTYTNEVHVEGNEEGVADYVAFRDGRIRGVFVDRTIVEIQTRQGTGNEINIVHSEMITNTGKKMVFGSVIPPEASVYIQHVYQFALWAFGNQDMQNQIDEEQNLVDRIQMNLNLSQNFLQSLDMLNVQSTHPTDPKQTKTNAPIYDIDLIQNTNLKCIDQINELLGKF